MIISQQHNRMFNKYKDKKIKLTQIFNEIALNTYCTTTPYENKFLVRIWQNTHLVVYR